jgi:hypothetical protein
MRPITMLSIPLLMLVQSPAMAAPACGARSGADAVPLVELYTSEGCSSCPPADRWFSTHVGDASANWLAFHVDYWDDIGWPDRFGSPLYSQRQRDRVAAAGGSTVYTPQVMVGPQVRASWHTGIGRELRQARTRADASLVLQLQPAGTGFDVLLGATRVGSAPNGANVWLAEYSDGQETKVPRGENGGLHLHHDRVVRHLWGPWPLGTVAVSQRVTVAVPSRRWGMTAFVQDASGRVWQSLNLPAAQCGG